MFRNKETFAAIAQRKASGESFLYGRVEEEK